MLRKRGFRHVVGDKIETESFYSFIHNVLVFTDAFVCVLLGSELAEFSFNH